MSTLFPLVVIVLGVAGIVGFLVVLAGVRQEERRMSLPVAPQSHSAAFARRVIGVHVRDTRPGRDDAGGGTVRFAVSGGAGRVAVTASPRPVRGVR
ncbi:hypothetical protein GCM10009677_43460 [Sphaerisporangium rubeum]|uniref:Uncharacterized protein n=1 Tax=Sphaerisporangium rubeum TaxID=321317 RepID=A0A7X0IJP7_9ACTN|nr:hypothetical protein [Sphaerisporangium rubeum]